MNSEFELDSRLAADCFELLRLEDGAVPVRMLLLNNAALPWLILVPETDATELTALPLHVQQELLQLINSVGSFVASRPEVTKLNIATIGNVVSQLHIHIVGRNPSDYCWPGVVWGTAPPDTYQSGQVDRLRDQLSAALGV